MASKETKTKTKKEVIKKEVEVKLPTILRVGGGYTTDNRSLSRRFKNMKI
tara:strand:- start:288 stop:437 length:150 start_codon:yes stop_codon:yes gene_type:complete